MKKKILFLIHDLGGGGAEKVLVNLVNHMDFGKYDIYVTALFGGGVNERNLSHNIHYSFVWRKPFPGNSRILKRFPAFLLHRICIKGSYDVEISYLEDVCAKVISGCQTKKTRKICWVHTDLHSKKVASRGFANFEESRKAFESFDQIVCVSDTVKNDFMAIYPDVNRIVTRYNTLETDRILQMKDEPVDVDFFDNEMKLVAVGKIDKNKGFDRLARIVKRLRDDGLPVHLYALGEGPDQADIEKYLHEKKILEFFTFLGYQTNPYKYVARCDLFVCASLSEGFSTAATEALIVGVPVCTVEVSGMKEMLGENNEWGMVVSNDDEALYQGIRKLLAEKELLAHYTKQVKHRGRNFSTENTVRAVEELIEEVIGKCPANFQL